MKNFPENNTTVEEDDADVDYFGIGLNQRSFLDPKDTSDEQDQKSLRPRKLSEYIGQEKIREHLQVAINACKRRNEPLDHVLLYGPPGLGKTTLAAIIANELGVEFRSTSGPVIEKPGDLAAILSSLNKGDVLFIDEIHRLNKAVEEVLYPAMEDYEIDIMIGQGPAARSIKLSLSPFTLVAATTRAGLLTAPLRSRFGIIERLDFYEARELSQIVSRSSAILGVEITPEGAEQIASRARGTPRIANRLLRRSRDYAEELAGSGITGEVANRALTSLDVDRLGLDRMDYQLMRTIIEKFEGGPVGLDTLAASLNEDRNTIEDVYEPYLLQLGFIKRTPRGREATSHALSYFEAIASFRLPPGKKEIITPQQRSLFAEE